MGVVQSPTSLLCVSLSSVECQMKTITYLQENSQLATIYPAPEALTIFGVWFIALKDTPPGVAFQIVEDGNVVAEGEGADFGCGSHWTVNAVARVDGVLWVRCTHDETAEERESSVEVPA